MTSNIKIIEYQQEHQPWFEKLNRHWIEKYFWMEPIDFDVLQHPEEHIIKKGGSIIMASYNSEMAGTVALKFVEPGVYEFTKMAVEDKFQGLKIGKALSLAAIEKAKMLGARSIILYSNRKLKTAISLYRKLGFMELPVDPIYKRSDIKMELRLVEEGAAIRFRQGTIQDAAVLATLGRDTFYESFAAFNTEEDMKLFTDKAYSESQLGIELQDADSTFFLAEEEKEVVGYAKIRINKTEKAVEFDNAIELERIYCSKSHIGKNVGLRLMQLCLHEAGKQGYGVMWLGVWEQNPRALAFYKKWGFEQFGSHPFLVGTDLQTDLLFKKNL